MLYNFFISLKLVWILQSNCIYSFAGVYLSLANKIITSFLVLIYETTFLILTKNTTLKEQCSSFVQS